MSNDPAGRVQLTLDPALPSLCIVCNRSSGNNVKFVDFNVSLDWYGAVVICEDCIKECITVVEYDPVTHFAEELSDVKKALEVANLELNKYKSSFDALRFIRPDLNPLSVDDGDESESDDENSDADSEPEPDSDGSDSVGGLENVSIFATDN